MYQVTVIVKETNHLLDHSKSAGSKVFICHISNYCNILFSDDEVNEEHVTVKEANILNTRYNNLMNETPC